MSGIIGLCALSAPILVAGVLILLTERQDGKSRFMIVNGCIGRRRQLDFGLKRKG